MTARLRITIHGAVQGVGFRPFVHRLAHEMRMGGWVRNDAHGVTLEVEGPQQALDRFLERVTNETPQHAVIQSMETLRLLPKGFRSFEIRDSESTPEASALVLPDLATCGECLRELFDAADRRYRYPFLNCTHCGPRFSIIDSLPYDRSRTAMRRFSMCAACSREYQDPSDRRFHAQPTACPDCGPQLTFLAPNGERWAEREEALQMAEAMLRQGNIIAVKGLGGFHLMVDARDETAVRRLRARKCREEKPLAVMFPSLEAVRSGCRVTPAEERLLRSAAAPIVLLDSIPGAVADSVAPGNRCLGAMIPYTPLHHLLLGDLGFPLVATSGNRTDEPICLESAAALDQLGDIADGFLVHDRPIRRRVDDSVVRVLLDRECVLRRARGYAPLPISVEAPLPAVLAVGGHQKNTVAFSQGTRIFVSPHLGDLETPAARAAFDQTVRDLPTLFGSAVTAVACDEHPAYASTAYAQRSGMPCFPVQHHLAHVLSCMLENDVPPPVLGVAWDGTGLGSDGTIWGGEFLLVEESGWSRIAHFHPFRLPGGDACAREPWRSALGMRFEMIGDAAFTAEHPPALRRMLQEGKHAPLTSSAGRLFDGVASLLGLRDRCSFEGQAAMELEQAAGECDGAPYPITVGREIDWRPMVHAMLADPSPLHIRAARVHQSLVYAIVQVALQAGPSQVVLSGGCFQNRLLVELADQQLRAHGLFPVWHQRLPPNDGGLSVGQIVGALRQRHVEQAYAQPKDEPCVLPFPEK